MCQVAVSIRCRLRITLREIFRTKPDRGCEANWKLMDMKMAVKGRKRIAQIKHLLPTKLPFV